MKMTRGAFQSISLSKCTKVLSMLLISLAQMNCEGKLMLEIGDDFYSKLTVNHSGSNVNGIDDVEAARLGLLPEKACAQKLGKRLGRDPDYCHWRGNVHRRFHWPEVQSVYRIQDVKPVENFTTPDVFFRTTVDNERGLADGAIEFTNNGEGLYMIKHENIGNNAFLLGGSVSVVYDPFRAGGGVSYEHTLGQTEFRFFRKPSFVRYTNQLSLLIKNFTVELRVLKETAVFNVTYQKYITGCIVADYYYPYEDHHFYCVDVEDNILPASYLVQTYTERLQIDCYKVTGIKSKRGLDM